MISYLDSNKWQAVKCSVDLLYMELCIIKKQNQVCMMLLWRNRLKIKNSEDPNTEP